MEKERIKITKDVLELQTIANDKLVRYTVTYVYKVLCSFIKSRTLNTHFVSIFS